MLYYSICLHLWAERRDLVPCLTPLGSPIRCDGRAEDLGGLREERGEAVPAEPAEGESGPPIPGERNFLLLLFLSLFSLSLLFQARYNIKYHHAAGTLEMKMTDDVVCLQYKTDAAQDVKKMEKFVNNLMRHMASKEQH